MRAAPTPSGHRVPSHGIEGIRRGIGVCFGLALVWSAALLAQPAADDAVAVQATGLLPPTAADLAWMDANMAVTRRVVPNILGLERINRERREKGLAEVKVATVPLGAESLATGLAGFPGGMDLTAATKDAGADKATLPAAVDNSSLPSFPPVRSQGSIGSCAAFSTCYYAGTHMTGLARGWNNRDNADNTRKLSPKWAYNFANNGVDGGSWFSTIMDVLMKLGCPSWAEFPYVGDGTTAANYLEWSRDAAVWRGAVSNRFAQIGRVEAVDTATGLANLKALLANGYVILYATHVFSWQFMPFSDDPATTADNALAGRQCCWKVSAAADSGHAMTLVGYNDDVWVDINKDGAVSAGEKGAVKVVNSWGTTGWGQAGSTDGFGWIAYDALRPTSAVAGVSNADRQAGFWNAEVYWITARTSYTPALLGQFTLSAARRNQLDLRVGASSATAVVPEDYFPTTTVFGWENGADSYWPQAFRYLGGARAFNGGTTAVSGTFVLDLTDLVQAGSRRYYIAVQDSTAGAPTSLTDFRLVTSAGTTLASAVAGIPGTADNATALAYADFSVTAPPQITSATTAAATVGLPFTYTITATNSPTSFAASGLPPGLTLDAGSGVISGTPTQAGAAYVVALSATNAGGVGTGAVTITVAAQTVATPAITSPATAVGTVGQAFLYTITATNSPTSFAASGLPAGLTLTAATGEIAGVPTAAGTFTVNLSAANAGGTGTGSVTLTIGAASALVPAITSSNTASGVSSSEFAYRIQATNGPTSFGAANLPGALTVDTASGDITGTLPAAGSYAITLSATNGAGTGYLALLLTVTGSSIYGPPNDAFANRITVSGTAADATGANANASAETGEPAHAPGSPAARSVWWAWTAPASGPVTIATTGSDFDTVLAAYTGASLAALSQVASDDDSGGSGTSQVTFQAAAGTAYAIAVDGYDGTTGQIVLTLRQTPSAGPANDAFASRISLAGSSASASGANQGATAEAGEPAHAGYAAAHSVWWTWTAPASGRVIIDTIGSDFDTLLAVYTGTAVNALTALAADDQSGGSNTSLVSFTVTAGTVCQIAVDGWSGQTGGIQLHVVLGAGAPANDAFANRAPLAGSSPSATGTSLDATAEANEPAHAGYAARHSVWWTWTAPGTGTVALDTAGSGFDTTLAVYTGSALASLVEVAANDDGAADFTSRLAFYATAGTTYQIAVDGYGGASGAIALHLVITAAASNDDFADRSVLAGGSCAVSGGNVGATAEANEPAHAGLAATRSVWWTWTAPAAGMVTVTTAGSTFDTIVAVYRGDALASLVSVVANDDAASDLTSEVVFFAAAGAVFQIAVDGYGGAQGGVELALSQTASDILYSTDFEDFPSGFEALSNYDGWRSTEAPATGTSGVFALDTQTAWLGFYPPANSNVFVFRPINYDPVVSGTPQITFSVDWSVRMSTAGGDDQFAFVLFNGAGYYLAVIVMDTSDLGVYVGDGVNALPRVGTFVADRTYHLEAVMDFAANRWSATLDDVPLFTARTLHAGARALTLGDMDAAWLTNLTGVPGNNYLVFDNYRLAITGQTAPVIETVSPLPGGVVGTPYHQTLAADGGTPPYTWTIAAGALPAGLSLAESGALAGTPLAAGTASFTVQVAGADGRSATQDFSLTVAKGAQTIAFPPLPATVYGAPDIALAATASSGLPVSYASSDPAVATVAAGAVHIVGTGSVVITAQQAGDAAWLAAPAVARGLTVSPAPLTITADDRSMIVGSDLPVLTATYTGLVNGDSAAGLDSPVLLTTTATPASAIGTYPIHASGAADANYTITHVDGTLTVFAASHTVTFLHGPNGALSGDTVQTVDHGGNTTPVEAVPAYGYVLDQWSDGSTANPRTVTDIIADVTVTASFQPAGPAPAGGDFIAITDQAAAAAGRGWWDLTGVYALSIEGDPLIINLIHDPKGKLTGSAEYTAGKATSVPLAVKGKVKGSAGNVLVTIALKGSDPLKTVSVALTLRMSIAAATGELVGSVTGSIKASGATVPVASGLVLPVAAPMDGSWVLSFHLVPGVKTVTGSAQLTLSSEAGYAYIVKGKPLGGAVAAALAAAASDPVAKGIKIKVTVRTLGGGWARLDTFSGKGFGQTLAW